jgi:uncharacterized protein involved in response to NO
MSSIPRLKRLPGPALLSYGFRPFFLLGALYAGAAVLIWLPLLDGEISLPGALSLLDWHVHEMLFGYVAAVITGFLLTAIPNWTGRLPIQGMPLLALVLVWIAGRAAVDASALIGWLAAALIDAAFLALVAAAAAREIVAGRNWRNLKIVAIVGVLAAANFAFHLEAHLRGSAEYSGRAAIGAIVLLIAIVGGRIVPSFTHNWLARTRPGRLPISYAHFDTGVILVSVAGLLLWLVVPLGAITGAALITAGLLQILRLVRWAGDRAGGEWLVLILHVGYAFVPIGFLLLGAAAVGAMSPSAGIHAWTVGAVGVMTLAVMTRASLGHTGHALAASPGTRVLYAAVVVAALARIAAAFLPQWLIPLLHLAAFAWGLAFLGFGVVYGPMLLRPRQ